MGEFLRGSQALRFETFLTTCVYTTKDGTIQNPLLVNDGKAHIHHPSNPIRKISRLYVLGNSKYAKVTQMLAMLLQ